jgi:hypothetical protein
MVDVLERGESTLPIARVLSRPARRGWKTYSVSS